MDRWTSRDGRLTLCEQHVKPVQRHIPSTKWDKHLPHELDAYRFATGHHVPCDFCVEDLEYLSVQDCTEPIATGGTLD